MPLSVFAYSFSCLFSFYNLGAIITILCHVPSCRKRTAASHAEPYVFQPHRLIQSIQVQPICVRRNNHLVYNFIILQIIILVCIITANLLRGMFAVRPQQDAVLIAHRLHPYRRVISLIPLSLSDGDIMQVRLKTATELLDLKLSRQIYRVHM